jgi:hypothetical protein
MAQGFRHNQKMSKPEEQAVLVYLDGSSLPDLVYEQFDLATLEDQLTAAITDKHLGEYDGNEFGPSGTTLFMYGPDAKALFSGIQNVLRAYPLCQKSRVVLRSGGPGAPTTEITLPLQDAAG